jgi:CheY-like chemotaxis protein
MIMDPIRAVVADDEPDSAAVFGLLLEKRFGCAVTVCHDGPTCIAAVKRVEPLIAFIDLQMPNMSGAAVAEELRKQEIPQAFLVALTGMAGFSVQKRCKDAGFDAYELKPLTADRVAELLVLAAQKVQR